MQVKTDTLLIAVEVAEILNISRAMAYKLMQTGEIPTARIGAARRVRPQDLQEFIKDNLSSNQAGNPNENIS